MVRTVDTERVAARDACASFLMRHVLFRHLAGRNPVLSRSAPLSLALQWTYCTATYAVLGIYNPTVCGVSFQTLDREAGKRTTLTRGPS